MMDSSGIGMIDLATLLGVTAPGSNEGVAVSWHHTWPWSTWLTLVVLLVAATLIVAIYLRERSQIHSGLRLALATIRIGLLGILLFMMYGWMMHRQRTDLPDLVIAIDVSESMSVQDQYPSKSLQAKVERRVQRAGLTSTTRLNLGKSLLLDRDRGWLQVLTKRYHVKQFYVGNDARRQTGMVDDLQMELRQSTATDTSSRLGTSLKQILQAQRGRPTAAIIYLTDGATTSGATLADSAKIAKRLAVPLYVVGIGNETPPRDALITDLLTDDVVFVDDVVNFDFTIQASGYKGQTATVKLRRQDSDLVLAEQTVTFAVDSISQTMRLTNRPTEEGVVEYVIELVPLEGEINVDNNRLTKRIDVRDSTIRVLFVQAYPNYEFRSLKGLLSRAVKSGRNSDKAIELTTILQTADVEYADQDATARIDFPVTRDELFAFDVVIFGDVNPDFLGSSIMQNLALFVTDRGGGIVFLAGSQFTPHAYRDTVLAPLFPFSLETVVVPDPNVMLTESFRVVPTPLGLETPHLQLGDSPGASQKIWNDLDGMFWLLETPDIKAGARVLANHSARTDDQGRPLPAILMQFVGAGKVVSHNIDETYLWSRHERRRPHYARYWLQMLRYLSRGKLLSEDQLVSIVTDRAEYQTGDPVRVSLRIATSQGGFDNETPATLMIQHENGSRSELALARDEIRGSFVGTIADLKPGTYRIWLMSPQLTPPPAAHSIRVVSPQSELTQLQMNAADLRLAASRSRGGFYSIHNADRLVRDLPRGRQVPIESLPVMPIWNSSILAGLFVALITMEWLLRKRAGMV
jgi:uncharacterized membrane protein